MKLVNKRILFVVILIIFLLIFSVVAYYFSRYSEGSFGNKNRILCTEEARLCNDGSYVSRNSSNQCEFDKCSEELRDGKR